MVVVLETELSDMEGNETLVVRSESMPPDTDVVGGHHEGESGAEELPHPMPRLLEMADISQHREHTLHHHPHVPGAVGTDLHVDRVARLGMKAGIGQHDHVHRDLGSVGVDKLLDQRMKDLVVGVGARGVPIHDPTPLIENVAELAAYDPTLVGETLATDLLARASFSTRMDQLDAVAVGHSQHGGFGQEPACPLLMGGEEFKEPCSLGQIGKHREQVSMDPTIESPFAASFEGEQQP